MMTIIPDHDTKMAIDLLGGGANVTVQGRTINVSKKLSNDDVRYLDRFIRERKAMVEAGLRRVPSWFQEELSRAFPDLRAWWDDWKQEWVIDKLQGPEVAERCARAAKDSPDEEARALLASAAAMAESGPYYVPVLRFTPTDKIQLDRGCIEWLRAHDLRRYSTDEVMAMKEEAAAKQRAENARVAEDNMHAIVDGMSSREIKEFLEVSNAIRTGETVECMGEDAKFMDRLRESTRQQHRAAELKGETLAPIPTDALNPGQNPLLRPGQ